MGTALGGLPVVLAHVKRRVARTEWGRAGGRRCAAREDAGSGTSLSGPVGTLTGGWDYVDRSWEYIPCGIAVGPSTQAK